MKLPEGWKEVMLGDVCEIKKGSSITKDKIAKGNIPVIAGGQQPAYYHNVSNRSGGVVTVSGSGAYAGFVAYFNISIFASDCSTIQTKSKDVSMKYIYYFLKGKQNKIYDLQRGIAQPHVYPKDLTKIKIPVPPFIKIQEKIVSILERTEETKNMGDIACELTDNLSKVIFAEMFGECALTNPLKEFIIFMTSGSRGWAKYCSEKGDIFLRIHNVDKNRLILEDLAYVAAPNNKESERTTVKAGDVLLSITADLGRTCVIPPSLPKAHINQHLAILRLSKQLNPHFVSEFLCSSKGMSQIKRLNKGGTKAGLNFNDIKSILISIPPKEQQNKFERIVEHIEALREEQKKSRQEIENLFNALLQKAFTGELVA